MDEASIEYQLELISHRKMLIRESQHLVYQAEKNVCKLLRAEGKSLRQIGQIVWPERTEAAGIVAAHRRCAIEM